MLNISQVGAVKCTVQWASGKLELADVLLAKTQEALQSGTSTASIDASVHDARCTLAEASGCLEVLEEWLADFIAAKKGEE